MILPEILRRKDIEKRFGLSRSTIYAMMADGRFPKPVKLGHRAVGWRSEDLLTWFDNMQEEA
jgi:prophage regulatory protein